MKYTSETRLKDLKKHIENLKEINSLKEKYNLKWNRTQLKPCKTISFKIRQKDLKDLLKLCSKKRQTKSEFIRKLVLKELKGGIKK